MMEERLYMSRKKYLSCGKMAKTTQKRKLVWLFDSKVVVFNTGKLVCK